MAIIANQIWKQVQDCACYLIRILARLLIHLRICDGFLCRWWLRGTLFFLSSILDRNLESVGTDFIFSFSIAGFDLLLKKLV